MTKKLKPAEPFTRNKKGEIISIDLAASAANDDWIRAARLAKRADAGDIEAKKELDDLENTQMFVDEDESE